MRTSGHHILPAIRLTLLGMVASTLMLIITASPALSQPQMAGEEPPGGPIVYNPLPQGGKVIAKEELGEARAGATIETRHDGGIASAEIFIDGKKVPEAALMGPSSYFQSVSTGIGSLEPGEHTVRVKATDLQGRTGGHSWTFTVAGSASGSTTSSSGEDQPSSPEKGAGEGQESTAAQQTEDTTSSSSVEGGVLPDTGGPLALFLAAAGALALGCGGLALLRRGGRI